MKLTGKQIKQMWEYVQENGIHAEYTIGKPIPYMNMGYRQYISTKGANKLDIADEDTF